MTGDWKLNVDESDALVSMYADHPEWVGQLSLWRDSEDGELRYAATVLPGLPDRTLSQFKQWARQAIEQALESGDPQANGWFPSESPQGGWYMTATMREMPAI